MRLGITTPVAFFGTAITGAVAWIVSSALRDNQRRNKPNYPKDVLEEKADGEGAISAVTGGHPEEMNEMPAGVAELEKARPAKSHSSHRTRRAS